MDIQNRVKKAESRLPAEVVQNGITVAKETASRLMTITIQSDDPKFDEVYLSNYTTLNVVDPLRRILAWEASVLWADATTQCRYGCSLTSSPISA